MENRFEEDFSGSIGYFQPLNVNEMLSFFFAYLCDIFTKVGMTYKKQKQMLAKVTIKILWGAFFLLYSTQAFSEISFQTEPKIEVLRELVTTLSEDLKTDDVFKNLVKNSFESLEKNEINQQELWHILFPDISSKVGELNESALAFLSTHGYEWSDYSSSDFSLLLSNSSYDDSSTSEGKTFSKLPCTNRIEAYAFASFALFEVGLALAQDIEGDSSATSSVISAVIFLMIDAIYCDCMLSTYGTGCLEIQPQK